MMRKASFFLTLTLGFLLTGCGKDSSGEATPLTQEEMASFASLGATMGQSMTDTAISYDSTPPALVKSEAYSGNIENPRSATSSLSNYTFNATTNYWDLTETLSDSSGTTSLNYDYRFSVGLWEGGSLTQTVSSALEKVTMYGSFDLSVQNSSTGESTSISMTIGNGISSPFTWTGINTGTVLVNGTFNFSVSANGQSAAMTMTFDNISVDTSGSNTYPVGSVDFSASSGSKSFSGTITYDGTSIAVATINGSSTNVDLSAAKLNGLL